MPQRKNQQPFGRGAFGWARSYANIPDHQSLYQLTDEYTTTDQYIFDMGAKYIFQR